MESQATLWSHMLGMETGLPQLKKKNRFLHCFGNFFPTSNNMIH